MTVIAKVAPDEIPALSHLAMAIMREHYDPIVGKAQNDYMLEKFQSESAIKEQIAGGYRYYFVKIDGKNVGFMAFYPRDGKMYISKFYLSKEFRGRGISKEMLAFVKAEARREGFLKIYLNVNKYNSGSIAAYRRLGFYKLFDEVNDIGNGYVMDDYVLECDA